MKPASLLLAIVLQISSLALAAPPNSESGPRAADIGFRCFKFSPSSGEKLAAFGYRKTLGGAMVVTAWQSGAPQAAANEVTFADAKFTEPVYADLLTGKVYEIPRALRSHDGGAVTFKQLPIYDSPPLLIAKKAALPHEAIAGR